MLRPGQSQTKCAQQLTMALLSMGRTATRHGGRLTASRLALSHSGTKGHAHRLLLSRNTKPYAYRQQSTLSSSAALLRADGTNDDNDDHHNSNSSTSSSSTSGASGTNSMPSPPLSSVSGSGFLDGKEALRVASFGALSEGSLKDREQRWRDAAAWLKKSVMGAPTNPEVIEHVGGSQASRYRAGLIQRLVEKQGVVTDADSTFDVCIARGQLDKAEILLRQKMQTQVNVTPQLSESINTLLFYMAGENQLLRCQALYNSACGLEGFVPTADTFAILLYAARSVSTDLVLEQIAEEAASYGVSTSDIFRSHYFHDAETRLALYQQAGRIGVSPPQAVSKPVFADVVTEFESQWELESDLFCTVPALPTKSTYNAWKAAMEIPAQQDEPVSVFSCFVPSVTRAITELRKETEEVRQQKDAVRETRHKLAYRYKSAPDHLLSPTEYMFASGLSDEQLAKLLLHEVEVNLRTQADGIPLNVMIMAIGKTVFREFYMSQTKRTGSADWVREVYRRYRTVMNNPQRAMKVSPSHLWRDIEKELAAEWEVDSPPELGISNWTSQVLSGIGAEAINLILSSTKLAEMTGDSRDDVPAFYHSYKFEGVKRFGYVCGNEKLCTHLKNPEQKDRFGMDVFRRAIHVMHLPMKIPPLPWTSLTKGAYLVAPSPFMRSKDLYFQHYGLVSEASHLMDDVFDAITHLSNTPWKVNSFVFDVAKRLFFSEEGFDALDIPPADLDVPDPLSRDATEEERLAHSNATRVYRAEKANAHSQRVMLHLKLMVAELMGNSTFYLPHNVDFRGRAYSTSSYLTHIGDDLSRGILTFGNKRPLGKEGLRWLKIHLSNTYGNDKCSLDDRERFADEHMQQVQEAAEQPLEQYESLESVENMWWAKGENPWQVLATCHELWAAVNAPNPELFESSLPVQTDGTCNGLQHYAALGGDIEGAKHVNLCRIEGDDRPQDVYSAVAATIFKHVLRHADGDLSHTPELADEKSRIIHLAKVIKKQGSVQRKIVKQTVMTNVYGVTFVGGREQILKQLRGSTIVDPEDVYDLATYLTRLVFISLSEIFENAQTIQRWLARQAKSIAASGEPVAWITPLGMPIVQPYHHPKGFLFRTRLQSVHLVEASSPQQLPSATKQASAFAPNFVHSLDATHMMYTANACHKSNITFASVHDSYWTHAATVGEMNRHTREQFAKLHSQPILQELQEFFKLHYEGRPILKTERRKKITALSDAEDEESFTDKVVHIEDTPPRGDFDPQEVLKARYFFS
eukprot:m.11806 g.11806  ORF g.11806 m.11806 type:complete len:1260 (+) comp5772_c0_seq1:65-3844(+)